jgi:hypothetical protein
MLGFSTHIMTKPTFMVHLVQQRSLGSASQTSKKVSLKQIRIYLKKKHKHYQYISSTEAAWQNARSFSNFQVPFLRNAN